MLFIQAYDFPCAVAYALKKKLAMKEWIYLHHPERLRGCEHPVVIRLPGYVNILGNKTKSYWTNTYKLRQAIVIDITEAEEAAI